MSMLAVANSISEADGIQPCGVQLERLGRHGLFMQASETFPRISAVDIESHAGRRGMRVWCGHVPLRMELPSPGAADPPRLYAGRGKQKDAEDWGGPLNPKMDPN